MAAKEIRLIFQMIHIETNIIIIAISIVNSHKKLYFLINQITGLTKTIKIRN